MIIPMLIYLILFIFFFCFIEITDGKTEGKGIGIVGIVPAVIFGSIINLVLLGVIQKELEKQGLEGLGSPVINFELSKKLCNSWFFDFINYFKKGGENMLQLYFQHPVAFIILVIVIVWGIKTILRAFRK